MEVTGYEKPITGKQLADKILHFLESARGYTAAETLSIIKRELEEVRRETPDDLSRMRR